MVLNQIVVSEAKREKTLDRTLAYHILLAKRHGVSWERQWTRMSDLLDEIAESDKRDVGFQGFEEEAHEHFNRYMSQRGQSVSQGEGFWVEVYPGNWQNQHVKGQGKEQGKEKGKAEAVLGSNYSHDPYHSYGQSRKGAVPRPQQQQQQQQPQQQQKGETTYETSGQGTHDAYWSEYQESREKGHPDPVMVPRFAYHGSSTHEYQGDDPGGNPVYHEHGKGPRYHPEEIQEYTGHGSWGRERLEPRTEFNPSQRLESPASKGKGMTTVIYTDDDGSEWIRHEQGGRRLHHLQHRWSPGV